MDHELPLVRLTLRHYMHVSVCPMHAPRPAVSQGVSSEGGCTVVRAWTKCVHVEVAYGQISYTRLARRHQQGRPVVSSV